MVISFKMLMDILVSIIFKFNSFLFGTPQFQGDQAGMALMKLHELASVNRLVERWVNTIFLRFSVFLTLSDMRKLRRQLLQDPQTQSSKYGSIWLATIPSSLYFFSRWTCSWALRLTMALAPPSSWPSRMQQSRPWPPPSIRRAMRRDLPSPL